jgi:hypothetical protein
MFAQLYIADSIARLDLTFRNVLPEFLHAGAMRGYWTLARFVSAWQRVTEKQQTLLLTTVVCRIFCHSVSFTFGFGELEQRDKMDGAKSFCGI